VPSIYSPNLVPKYLREGPSSSNSEARGLSFYLSPITFSSTSQARGYISSCHITFFMSADQSIDFNTSARVRIYIYQPTPYIASIMSNFRNDQAKDVPKMSKDQSKGKKIQHKRSKKVYDKGEEKTPKHIIIAMLETKASRSAGSEASFSEVPSHPKVIQYNLKKRLLETHYSLLGHMPVPRITRRDSSTYLLLYHSNSHSNQ
jgi:hypothetical protein